MSSRKVVIKKGKYNYELDGLVFTKLGVDYNEPSVKWKPVNMQTADFLLWKDSKNWRLYSIATFNYIFL